MLGHRFHELGGAARESDGANRGVRHAIREMRGRARCTVTQFAGAVTDLAKFVAALANRAARTTKFVAALANCVTALSERLVH